MNLTEFLLARIAEDEARPDCDGSGEYASCARWSEQRERESAAKRLIVGAHPLTNEIVGYGARTHDFGCVTCHDWDGMTCGMGYCDTLRALASVYADHPDYRQEWKP